MTGERAPQETLRRLVEDKVLSAGQADAVLRALADARPETRVPRIRWAEVAGYLGGGLVLTGVILLVASSWDRWSETARTAATGVSALLLFVAGVIAAGGITGLMTARHEPPTARLRVSGTLLALAAGTAAITVGIAMPDHAGSAGAAIASGMGLVLAIATYALVPTAIGLIASAALLIATILFGLDASVGTGALRAGLGMVTAGLLIAGLAVRHVLRHRLLGLGLGAAIAMYGAQQPLGDSRTTVVAYLLTFVLGAACLALYHREQTWVLLVVGVLGIALAVPEAVWDLTDGAAGGAAIVLSAGLVLLAASGIGLRLRRRAPADAPPIHRNRAEGPR